MSNFNEDFEKNRDRNPFIPSPSSFKNRPGPSLPREREASPAKKQEKQKLLSWELLRTQELAIPEISEGNLDCT